MQSWKWKALGQLKKKANVKRKQLFSIFLKVTLLFRCSSIYRKANPCWDFNCTDTSQLLIFQVAPPTSTPAWQDETRYLGGKKNLSQHQTVQSDISARLMVNLGEGLYLTQYITPARPHVQGGVITLHKNTILRKTLNPCQREEKRPYDIASLIPGKSIKTSAGHLRAYNETIMDNTYPGSNSARLLLILNVSKGQAGRTSSPLKEKTRCCYLQCFGTWGYFTTRTLLLLPLPSPVALERWLRAAPRGGRRDVLLSGTTGRHTTWLWSTRPSLFPQVPAGNKKKQLKLSIPPSTFPHRKLLLVSWVTGGGSWVAGGALGHGWEQEQPCCQAPRS